MRPRCGVLNLLTCIAQDIGACSKRQGLWFQWLPMAIIRCPPYRRRLKGCSICFMGYPYSLPWGIVKITTYDFWTKIQSPVQRVLNISLPRQKSTCPNIWTRLLSSNLTDDTTRLCNPLLVPNCISFQKRAVNILSLLLFWRAFELLEILHVLICSIF